MKFELSDERVLLVSGVGCAAFATLALTAPRQYHNLFMEKTQITNDISWRWFGQALASKGTSDMALSVSGANKKALKSALKVSGVQWLLAASHLAYRAHEGTQRKEISCAAAVGNAAIGALCLWRGFDDSDL